MFLVLLLTPSCSGLTVRQKLFSENKYNSKGFLESVKCTEEFLDKKINGKINPNLNPIFSFLSKRKITEKVILINFLNVWYLISIIYTLVLNEFLSLF